MKLADMSFFRLASQRMEWLAARQKVIAENVANADTPGFSARDVQGFEDFLNARAAGPRNSSLLARSEPVAIGDAEESWGQSLDRNTVVQEQQALLAADTSDQYRLATQLYKKGFDLIALAASGR